MRGSYEVTRALRKVALDACFGCAAQLWDLRAKRSVHTLQETYQVTAVAFAEAGDQVYSGGIENVIKVTIFWSAARSLDCRTVIHKS